MANVPEAVITPHRIQVRSIGLSRYLEADSSLIHEVQDDREVEKIFDKYNYIPPATVGGRSAMKFIWYLMQSMQFSETKGAVVRKVNNFSFGGKYSIVRAFDAKIENPYIDENIPSKKDWERYYEWHTSVDLCGEDYISLANKLGVNEQTNGMRAIEVIYSRTFGQDLVTLSCIAPHNLMRKWTGNDSYGICAISPRWDDGYLGRNPAREVPIWPNFKEFEDGTRRTVIYQKSGLYKYYGRPDDIASFSNQYNEFKLNEFITKQIDSNFIAQTILEIAGDGNQSENAFKNGNKEEVSTLELLKSKFTNRGKNPSPIVPMTRPPEAKAFKAHDIKPNMSHEYYKALLDQFETSIHKSNDFPKALMMVDSSGFNSSQFKDAFEIVSATKIMTHQLRISSVINEALQVAAEWTGNEWAKDYSVKYSSALQRLINEKADAEKAGKITRNDKTVVD